MGEGHIIICGGMGGIMDACAKGGRSSQFFEQHRLIGILPTSDYTKGSPFMGVKIATHLGKARNFLIILNADAVVAIGGGAGTLNEIATAWELQKPIAGHVGGGGWSEKLAGQSIDSRRKDSIVEIRNISDLINLLKLIENRQNRMIG